MFYFFYFSARFPSNNVQPPDVGHGAFTRSSKRSANFQQIY